jgi:protein phosphatase PTC7
MSADNEPMHPLDVIIEGWTQTCHENVVGSSTMCVAFLDEENGQLTYSNIGDGGILVVRNIDPDRAGYRQQNKEREEKMQIVFLSQQQLRGFNLPYQVRAEHM